MLNFCCKRTVCRAIESARCHPSSKGSHGMLDLFNRHFTSSSSPRKFLQKAKPKKIDTEEFKTRRDKVVGVAWSGSPTRFDQLLLCIPSSRTYYMAKDIPYVFRQNADFRYLSGVTEPDSLLLLHCSSKDNYRSVLFLPDADREHKRWHGPSLARDEVESTSGIIDVHCVSELEEFLQDILRQSEGQQLGVFCDPSRSWLTNAYSHDSSPATFSVLEDCIMQKPKNWTTVTALTQHIQEARVIKSQTEADMMRYACSISAAAFKKAITETEAGMNERQLWVMMDYECVFNGADRLAFPPVVASGPRAATIHYIKNSEVMLNGQMVLVDAGCEVEGYCSDMSRAWPVGTSFTNPQRILYEIVQHVQARILQRIDSLGSDYGNYPSLNDLYGKMLDLLTEELFREGLFDKFVDKKKAREMVTRTYCGHHLGHYVGMDVHDCHLVSRGRKLQEGMAFTVEPGLYIASDDTLFAGNFRGIGIRIEDIVWLGPNGPENFSRHLCPSEVSEIVSLRRYRDFLNPLV